MRRAIRIFLSIILAALILGSAFAAFWLGLVPASWSPLSALSFDTPPGWFSDAQLASLRRDPARCRALLKPPHIEAVSVADKPFRSGCGWSNAYRVDKAGDVAVGAEPLTCEMAAALTLWIKYELQPAAWQILGSKVVGIDDFGTYDCRRMIGNSQWRGLMSEHASANAFDISGFTLADGRKITFAKHWIGSGPEARFLREAHARACDHFRVTLSPDFNAAHRDHMHIDRGAMWTCR